MIRTVNLLFFAIPFLILGSLVVSVLGGFYPNYSDGFRSGVLMKASTKGIFCKTTEGELVLGGFGSRVTQTQGGGINNVWAFTARDPAIRQKLEALSGQNVKIKYHQWLVKPWCGDTDYEVVDVQVVQ